jgi:hypothetical protein
LSSTIRKTNARIPAQVPALVADPSSCLQRGIKSFESERRFIVRCQKLLGDQNLRPINDAGTRLLGETEVRMQRIEI